MISNLEKALECVLALEEIYSASSNSNTKNASSLQQQQNAFELNLNNLSTYSSDFPLTGNHAVDVLLKGGVPRLGTATTTQQNNNVCNSNEQNQNRKEIAKRNWKELDRLLLEISKNETEKLFEDDAAEKQVKNYETNRDQKILSDILKGRPDRWVRVASVAEKEAKRQEFMRLTQHEEILQQRLKNNNNSDVVLGSAASSVSRMILQTLLNS
jgi:hypothetical protein